LKHHRIIPEISLTPSEIDTLLATFREYQNNEIQYITKFDELVPLWLMSNYERSELVHRLESKLYHVRNSYFLRNMGTTRHRDHLRKTVISYVLDAPHDIPTTIYSDDHEPVEYIYYKKGDAVIWDVSRLHEVPRPSPERIFFQIEMDRRFSYGDYIKMLEAGELFRW